VKEVIKKYNLGNGEKHSTLLLVFILI